MNAATAAVAAVHLDNCLAKQYERDLAEARRLLKGRPCRIVKPYNGQPFGRSRRNIQGEIHRIEDVCLGDGKIIFWLEGYHYGCPALTLDMVELVDGAA